MAGDDEFALRRDTGATVIMDAERTCGGVVGSATAGPLSVLFEQRLASDASRLRRWRWT